ncbi:unnamed protein product, partial [Amoebophrya sp. A25]|eukprot:GSA25T00010151001.1
MGGGRGALGAGVGAPNSTIRNSYRRSGASTTTEQLEYNRTSGSRDTDRNSNGRPTSTTSIATLGEYYQYPAHSSAYSSWLLGQAAPRHVSLPSSEMRSGWPEAPPLSVSTGGELQGPSTTGNEVLENASSSSTSSTTVQPPGGTRAGSAALLVSGAGTSTSTTNSRGFTRTGTNTQLDVREELYQSTLHLHKRTTAVRPPEILVNGGAGALQRVSDVSLNPESVMCADVSSNSGNSKSQSSGGTSCANTKKKQLLRGATSERLFMLQQRQESEEEQLWTLMRALETSNMALSHVLTDHNVHQMQENVRFSSVSTIRSTGGLRGSQGHQSQSQSDADRHTNPFFGHQKTRQTNAETVEEEDADDVGTRKSIVQSLSDQLLSRLTQIRTSSIHLSREQEEEIQKATDLLDDAQRTVEPEVGEGVGPVAPRHTKPPGSLLSEMVGGGTTSSMGMGM